MRIIEYKNLVEEAKEIRIKVFLEEQGFTEEFDEIDPIAIHLVAYEENEAIGTCRIYYNQVKKSYVIGRIAVIKEWRGKKVGSSLINEAEKIINFKGGESVMLSAQVRVSEFYESLGYHKFGVVFMDEDCPHIWMKKELCSV